MKINHLYRVAIVVFLKEYLENKSINFLVIIVLKL